MSPATDAEKEIGRLTLALAEAEKKAERDYLRFVEADREEIERLREEITRLRAELASVTEERDYVMAEGLFSADQIRILKDERDAAIAERDKMLEVLKPFVPETQWIDTAIPDTRPIDVMVRAGELRAARDAIREGATDE